MPAIENCTQTLRTEDRVTWPVPHRSSFLSLGRAKWCITPLQTIHKSDAWIAKYIEILESRKYQLTSVIAAILLKSLEFVYKNNNNNTHTVSSRSPCKNAKCRLRSYFGFKLQAGGPLYGNHMSKHSTCAAMTLNVTEAPSVCRARAQGSCAPTWVWVEWSIFSLRTRPILQGTSTLQCEAPGHDS